MLTGMIWKQRVGLGNALYIEVFNQPTRMSRVVSEHALSVEPGYFPFSVPTLLLVSQVIRPVCSMTCRVIHRFQLIKFSGNLE